MEPAGTGAGPADPREPTLPEVLAALERARARQAAIARLGRTSLRDETSGQALITQALEALRGLLPCDQAALVEVGVGELRVLAATDPAVVGLTLDRARSLADLAARADEPTRVDDLVGDPRIDVDGRLTGGPLTAGWAVPLRVGRSLRTLVCAARGPWADDLEAEACFLQATGNVLVGDAARREAASAARAGEERFRRLAENVPDAVFHLRLRPERHTEYVSPRYAELTGLPLEELERDPDAWRRVVHPDDLPALDAVLDVPGAEVIATPPYRLVHAGGAVRWVETRVAPLRDAAGQLTAVFGATRDITILQETEEALRRALEREQLATEELRQLGELKNALLAAVSHELRTPLTAVVGFAELLQRHDHDLPAERRRHLLARLNRNARRLERLLGDLLDLDRLDRSVVEPVRRPTDVSELIGRVVSRLDASDRTIHLELAPLVVPIDGPKMERIVENLLVNAVKHTHAGSSVWVRTDVTGDELLLVVEDDGPGVDDELKPTVFDAFVRGGASHRDHSPGTGIGLSLVARFAELHGGRAWVVDREGGGASFRVVIPLGPAEQEADLARRIPDP
jgi:PAS domain S-box-containing protein